MKIMFKNNVLQFQSLCLSKITESVRKNWHGHDQLLASDLCVKYAILHKIGFTNWCPSMHGTGISPALASLLYHIERK